MKTTFLLPLVFAIAVPLFLTRCNQPSEAPAPPPVTQDSTPPPPVAEAQPVPNQRKAPDSLGFTLVKTKKWLAANDSLFRDSANLKLLLAINRVDSASLVQQEYLLIPKSFSGDLSFYLPFPVSVPGLRDIKRIIFFSYPAQAFGAYENGELVYTGPTNMGRKKDRTPTGLFFTNWKAEETTSTFNDEWELKWNFNIENKLGIGWHQYAMPGYPASHSCLRLLEWDARYLYDWAQQWKLDDKDNVVLKGTPVIVYGDYPFGGRRPWLALAKDSAALHIDAALLDSLAAPHLNEIKKQQAEKEQQVTKVS
jgi:hypothetical protein